MATDRAEKRRKLKAERKAAKPASLSTQKKRTFADIIRYVDQKNGMLATAYQELRDSHNKMGLILTTHIKTFGLLVEKGIITNEELESIFKEISGQNSDRVSNDSEHEQTRRDTGGSPESGLLPRSSDPESEASAVRGANSETVAAEQQDVPEKQITGSSETNDPGDSDTRRCDSCGQMILKSSRYCPYCG